MLRCIALGFALLLACTAREREPAAAERSTTPQAESEPESPPLVTLELAQISREAATQLAAIHGPDSPLTKADLLLVVHHRIAPPWHIYWLNPGESGLRTKLSFDATGVDVGPVVYPAPERFVASGGQVSYGWERDAVLFVPLEFSAGEAHVKVRSDWLACHESCIPGHSEASARIADLVGREEDPLVREMIERIPEPASDRLRTSWTGSTLRVEPPADAKLLAFFPYASDKAIVQATTLGDDALDLEYRFDGSPPDDLGQGVVNLSSSTGETRWLELAAPWPP